MFGSRRPTLPCGGITRIRFEGTLSPGQTLPRTPTLTFVDYRSIVSFTGDIAPQQIDSRGPAAYITDRSVIFITMKSPPLLKPVPRWVRRKDARPEEITAAALTLFVERGYANTRLDDVAGRSGVSKGTLYLYFANKEDLFKAVVREGLVSPIAEVRDLIDRYEGSSFDLLSMVLHGWWQRIGSTPVSGIPKLILAEARNFPEIAKFYLDEVVRPGLEAIVGIIERGIRNGEFRSVDSRQVAQLVFAPTLLVACWCNSLEPFDPEGMDPIRVIEEHLEMLRRGLAPDAKPSFRD